MTTADSRPAERRQCVHVEARFASERICCVTLWGMAKLGRPKAALVITDVERTELVRLTKRAHVNRLLAFTSQGGVSDH